MSNCKILKAQVISSWKKKIDLYFKIFWDEINENFDLEFELNKGTSINNVPRFSAIFDLPTKAISLSSLLPALIYSITSDFGDYDGAPYLS